MRAQRDSKVLEMCNKLGQQIADLFENESAVVVINVTLALFVGACLSDGLEREYIHELVDNFINSGERGLTGEVVKVQ